MQSLQAGFREQPLEKVPIAPVLSEWTTMFASQYCYWVSQYIASSNTIDSAQPMSWLSQAQPSISCQPESWFPIAKPTPKDKDSSMCRLGSMHTCGFKEHISEGYIRHAHQRSRSFSTVSRM